MKTVGEVGIGFVNHDASEDAKARVPKDVSDHEEVAVKKVESAATHVVAKKFGTCIGREHADEPIDRCRSMWQRVLCECESRRVGVDTTLLLLSGETRLVFARKKRRHHERHGRGGEGAERGHIAAGLGR